MTVNLSHAENPMNTFSTTFAPVLASAIDQLSMQSVNEITPHMEALASIVEGDCIHDFFQNVVDECHKHQKKLESKEPSAISGDKQEVKDGREREDLEKQKESEIEKKREREELDKQKTSEVEEIQSPQEKVVATEQVSPKENASTNSARNQPTPAPKITQLKEAAEGVEYKYKKKNGTGIILKRKGDKLIATILKPNITERPTQEIDLNTRGEETVKTLVDTLTAVKKIQ
ncbi:hypothetical protein V9T40_013652 [Parthenolecanium corni]|uniref:Uncharacterized protein n=1 Tax=Parthenolecanium corni TaxID=536013 RepID=A0AAN9Y1H0_9HEMI